MLHCLNKVVAYDALVNGCLQALFSQVGVITQCKNVEDGDILGLSLIFPPSDIEDTFNPLASWSSHQSNGAAQDPLKILQNACSDIRQAISTNQHVGHNRISPK